MSRFRRFGRRMPIPSTLQISHELRDLSAHEEARVQCALEEDLPRWASWEEIAASLRAGAIGLPELT